MLFFTYCLFFSHSRDTAQTYYERRPFCFWNAIKVKTTENEQYEKRWAIKYLDIWMCYTIQAVRLVQRLFGYCTWPSKIFIHSSHKYNRSWYKIRERMIYLGMVREVTNFSLIRIHSPRPRKNCPAIFILSIHAIMRLEYEILNFLLKIRNTKNDSNYLEEKANTTAIFKNSFPFINSFPIGTLYFQFPLFSEMNPDPNRKFKWFTILNRSAFQR